VQDKLYFLSEYRPQLWVYPCSWLTPWSEVFLENWVVSHLFKKFPAFDVTWRFITVFTRARHLSVSWARWIKHVPFQRIYEYLISISVLSFCLYLGFPSGLFLSPILVTILLFLMLPPGIIFAEEQKLTDGHGPQKSWGIWFETHCLFCWSDLSLGFVHRLNFDVTLLIRKWTKPKEWRLVQ
jgi:hypothetical protein